MATRGLWAGDVVHEGPGAWPARGCGARGAWGMASQGRHVQGAVPMLVSGVDLQGTAYMAQRTVNRARSIGHGAQSTGHRALAPNWTKWLT